MNDAALIEAGKEVAELLAARRFDELGSRFDYALKFQDDAKSAIEHDFDEAACECTGNPIDSPPLVSVSHLQPNDAGLVSLVECRLQYQEATGVLAELVLNSAGNLYLEQVSGYGERPST
ncbi:MAG: hypothetical protein AAF680_12625 [Pseudomonadota bacterium]